MKKAFLIIPVFLLLFANLSFAQEITVTRIGTFAARSACPGPRLFWFITDVGSQRWTYCDGTSWADFTPGLNNGLIPTSQIPAALSSTTSVNGTTIGGSKTLLTTDAAQVLNHPTIGISGTSASAHVLSVGTAPSCAFTSGGGTGSPSCAMETGSTDMGGTMTLTTGTSPGSAGTVTLTFNASMGTNNPVCVCSPTKGATDWSVSSTVRITTQSKTAPVFTWNSQSATALVSLTGATNYQISYICIAK